MKILLLTVYKNIFFFCFQYFTKALIDLLLNNKVLCFFFLKKNNYKMFTTTFFWLLILSFEVLEWFPSKIYRLSDSSKYF